VPNEAGSPEAALRLWMREILILGKLPRTDLARSRRNEKESIEARIGAFWSFHSQCVPTL